MDNIKTYDCNECSNKYCKGDVIRNKFGKFKKFKLCPGQVKPNRMKVSLLELASVHDGYANVLSNILGKLNLRYVETFYYPYFKFLLKGQ